MLKENKERFGLRKLSVGLASVMLGVVAMSSTHGTTVHADSVKDGDVQDVAAQDVQNSANQKEEATKSAQVVKEVAPQVNKADAKAVTTTVRGGTDLVKNPENKSVASDVNKNGANVAGGETSITTTAFENITDKKTVGADGNVAKKTADAVKSDEATQSFNVQKNNINGISEKVVESNLTEDTNDPTANWDPAKLGFHKTNAGWTKYQQGKQYTSVAKESHTILLNYGTSDELPKNNSIEVGDAWHGFGIDINATVDKKDIIKGNRILLSSTAFLYPDGRHFTGDLDTSINKINVVSNGVKIGHIEGTWDNPFHQDLSAQMAIFLVVDQTQNDMTKDVTLHIRQSSSNRIDPWGNNQWLFLKGTSTSNPAHIKIVTNDNTAYNYTMYVDPKYKQQPMKLNTTDNTFTGGQELNLGNLWFGSMAHDPDKPFTWQEQNVTKVFKISRPQSIDGVTIPNFKSSFFVPYLTSQNWYPVYTKNGTVTDVCTTTFNIQGYRLADGASVQQVADVAKDKHFVYSISDDGQSVILGINTNLDFATRVKESGLSYTPHDAVNDVTNALHNTRAVVIDYADQSQYIINKSVNWVKEHNGDPYKITFGVIGLPADTNQPNIQTFSDVTPGETHGEPATASLFPKNSTLTFDASVYRNIHVKYIDDDNHGAVLPNTDTFQTSTGTDLTYNIKSGDSAGFNSATDIAFPSNYVLNQDVTVHYGVVQDKNKDIEIHVKHLVKTIDGSSNLDLYPNIKKALNGDSTRTFHITYPAGRQGSNPSTIVQSIHFIRSGKADFSTDTVDASTLTAWKPVASTAHGVTIANGVANFDSITLPRIAGYHAQVNTNKANPAMFLVSFVANSMPNTPTDNKDQNTNNSNTDITTPKTSDDKHETIPETPSVINDGLQLNQTTHDWTINSIKSNDYLVSNGVDNYSLPIIGKTGLSIIKTSSNTLAFTYIKLNTPNDYVFTLTKRHKMYQLTVNKLENGKLTAIKTFRSHNYKDLMKELKKMAF